jgi:hypothetical protein
MTTRGLRELPVVDLGLMQRIQVDGLVERVRIFGDDFYRTFYVVTTPDGSSELVRAPILEMRQAIKLYVPNYLNTLLIEEQKRLLRGRRSVDVIAQLVH